MHFQGNTYEPVPSREYGEMRDSELVQLWDKLRANDPQRYFKNVFSCRQK